MGSFPFWMRPALPAGGVTFLGATDYARSRKSFPRRLTRNAQCIADLLPTDLALAQDFDRLLQPRRDFAEGFVLGFQKTEQVLGRDILRPIELCRRLRGVWIGRSIDDPDAQGDTTVADEDRRPGDQLLHLVLRLPAKRTKERP